MHMRVCYLDCHDAGLCCYLVVHIENPLRPLQLFYFCLWLIYWLYPVLLWGCLQWHYFYTELERRQTVRGRKGRLYWLFKPWLFVLWNGKTGHPWWCGHAGANYAFGPNGIVIKCEETPRVEVTRSRPAQGPVYCKVTVTGFKVTQRSQLTIENCVTSL
jgi:hypothetical protein